MTKEQRLSLLIQIEEQIYVPSLESTLSDDLKSVAIHSIIEEEKDRLNVEIWNSMHGKKVVAPEQVDKIKEIYKKGETHARLYNETDPKSVL